MRKVLRAIWVVVALPIALAAVVWMALRGVAKASPSVADPVHRGERTPSTKGATTSPTQPATRPRDANVRPPICDPVHIPPICDPVHSPPPKK